MSGCFVCVIAYFVLILGIRFVLTSDPLSKDEIFDIVNNKYDIIISDIQKDEFTKSERIKGVVEVEDCNGVVRFVCRGTGTAVSGVDCGFYYTADDLPKVSFLRYVLFSEEDLLPEGKGFCFNKFDYFYTEKIRDNFYYYESHY